jgi:hypothetical protein
MTKLSNLCEGISPKNNCAGWGIENLSNQIHACFSGGMVGGWMR